MTPGYKTSEFYIMLVAMLSTIILASGAIPEGSVYAAILTILAGLYSGSRTIIKSRTPSIDTTIKAPSIVTKPPVVTGPP